MLSLDANSFDAEVTSRAGLVVVDWWGPRCVPCTNLMPHMEELARRWEGQVGFVKVNVEQNRRLAIREQIMGLPTIAFYRDGQKVDQLSGMDVSLESVRSRVQALQEV